MLYAYGPVETFNALPKVRLYDDMSIGILNIFILFTHEPVVGFVGRFKNVFRVPAAESITIVII